MNFSHFSCLARAKLITIKDIVWHPSIIPPHIVQRWEINKKKVKFWKITRKFLVISVETVTTKKIGS